MATGRFYRHDGTIDEFSSVGHEMLPIQDDSGFVELSGVKDLSLPVEALREAASQLLRQLGIAPEVKDRILVRPFAIGAYSKVRAALSPRQNLLKAIHRSLCFGCQKSQISS